MKVWLLRRTIFSTLFLAVLFNFEPASGFNTTEFWNGFSTSCDSEDPQRMSLSCHGVRIIRKVVQQLLIQSSTRRKIELFNGISLAVSDDAGYEPRSNQVDSILDFLESRELRIKLPNLLPDNVEPALNQTIQDLSTGRGKGGKKGGSSMTTMMLMCKMLAAVGFGALGLLAMKALMISTLALMLSLIVAAKKLQGGGGHHHHDAHLVYAQDRRKKRDISLEYDKRFSPYKGYVHYVKL